jgi:shikimate 5-dehydrogenase
MNFCSVSINPGKTGTFFYTRAFQTLGIDASYMAVKCSSLQDIYKLIKSRIYSGISVSMPFKSEVHNLCTEVDASTYNGKFINTLKIDRDGKVKGFNTDLGGVNSAISRLTDGDISIYGDGAMSKLFSVVLTESSRSHQIFSRKAENWNQREAAIDNIINCTPIGMDGHSSPIDKLGGVKFVADLVINGKKLEGLAIEHQVPYFSGMDFYLNVFVEQFAIYTDQELTRSLVDSINAEWKSHAP